MPDDPEGTLSRVGTPQAAGLAWVEAVMDAGDLARAWPLTDPTLRVVLAQEWLWDRRDEDLVAAGDRDAASAALARCPPDHPTWELFAADRVAGWRQVWRGFGSESWLAMTETEIVDLDLEVVTLVERAAAAGAAEAAPFARRFLLRHTPGGWLVAGLNGEQRFRPGWPPSPVSGPG